MGGAEAGSSGVSEALSGLSPVLGSVGETWAWGRVRGSPPRSGVPRDFQITVLHPMASSSIVSSAASRMGPAMQSGNSTEVTVLRPCRRGPSGVRHSHATSAEHWYEPRAGSVVTGVWEKCVLGAFPRGAQAGASPTPWPRPWPVPAGRARCGRGTSLQLPSAVHPGFVCSPTLLRSPSPGSLAFLTPPFSGGRGHSVFALRLPSPPP